MKFSDYDSRTQQALTYGYLVGMRLAIFNGDELLAMVSDEAPMRETAALIGKNKSRLIGDIEGFNDRDRCGTCRFYADEHCHRNPPSAYPRHIYGLNSHIPDRTIFTSFPQTIPAMWCGAYERQKG